MSKTLGPPRIQRVHSNFRHDKSVSLRAKGEQLRRQVKLTLMAHILIVDDESNIRLMLRLALQKDGHSIATAADGPDALEQWGAGDVFDLTLLDHRMPQMEGIEFLRAMKARRKEARVIMVTAFGTVDLALEAQRAGAANFLRKPFTTEVLRAAVATALSENAPAFLGDNPDAIEGMAVNGFRIEAADETPARSDNGGLIHRFSIQRAGGERVACRVVFPAFFIELVKSHADRETLGESERFWLWLGEEALANYLWQNAAPPPNGELRLEELPPNLKRWMDAVLTR